ncbi:MAG: signal recognition particle-docking protein FtsY [Planctomycetaceae bacterium]|jgi:fused signal recognition particle receptor|nr:signal recognition particle-docking protein FtsY [Planctomycetaceae bacterium]
MGLFDRLKQGLQKTKDVLRTDVRDLFQEGQILDEDQLRQLEGRLLKTDMGVVATSAIVGKLREEYGGRTVDVDTVLETVKDTLKEQLAARNDEQEHSDVNDPLSPLNLSPAGLTVILVAGVNGVGKTTSIAKLARLLISSGRSLVLVAGDTFRAAAVEQLTMWSQRLGCEIVTRPSGTDPASVAYAGCDRALEAGVDCVIIDTAGRLQTDHNLMRELQKIHRVIGEKVPGAPHESLLVLDATTGQNGISQAKNFSEVVECTGIVLAKLDGTARGGIVVPIRQQMNLPVKYVGVGEGVDDLEPFDANWFVDVLFDDGP